MNNETNTINYLLIRDLLKYVITIISKIYLSRGILLLRIIC